MVDKRLEVTKKYARVLFLLTFLQCIQYFSYLCVCVAIDIMAFYRITLE